MKTIWVYGPSCAGKKTAILEAANVHKPSWLREMFNIQPPIIPVIFGRGQNSARYEYIDSVLNSGIEATFIIHGQRCDLKGYIEDKKGKAVFIFPSRNTHKRRYNKRGVTVPYKPEKWKEHIELLKHLDVRVKHV